MKFMSRIAEACAVGFLVFCCTGYASEQPGQNGNNQAAVAQTLGSRGYVDRNFPIFGGFELANTTVVYVLVRGPSLNTLAGITGYLDFPRVRLYDGAGRDLITGLAQPGTGGCFTNTVLNIGTSFVINYYQNVRRQPVNARDTCFAFTLPAGVYTFDARASIPGLTTSTDQSSPAAGEVLFEVTLGPSS
jgi:hypothetical protein